MKFSQSLAIITLLGGQANGFQSSPSVATIQSRSVLSLSASVTEGSVDTSLMQQQSPPSPPDMQAYSNGFKTVFDEVSCSLSTPTEGELPPDLMGTYYKSGPAMFSAGSLPPPKNSLVKPKQPPVPDGEDMSRMVLHPFDADGAVLAMTFHGQDAIETGDSDADEAADIVDTKGKVTTRFRYVRTNAFNNERKKGKKLYTGMESTRSNDSGGSVGNDLSLPFYRHHLLNGLNKLRKNTSNTRAVYFGKRLLTMWAGGLPYKLDSLALSTDGRSQLGGIIKKEESAMSSSAVIDSKRNRILFYGIDEGSSGSTLNIYEFNSKFQSIKDNDGAVQLELPGLALVYDFGVTENYCLFVQPQLKVNGMQYMLNKEPGKSATLESQSSLLHIVARPSNKDAGGMKTIEIPFDGMPEANLQIINAYENEDGTIILDAIRSTDNDGATKSNTQWPWASTLGDFQNMSSKKSLWRYEVNPKKGLVSKTCISQDQLYFGVINSDTSAQKHRYIYAAVGAMGESIAPPQGITKFDTDTGARESWFPESYEFCGEPMYAERRGDDSEDGGYILSTLFNGKDESSELVVLKANDVGAGPIARVPVGIAVPHGYHGCFASTDDANWTYEQIERRAKLADKMETRGSMWNEVKSDFSGLGLRFDDMEEYFGDLM
mmetsp:Transcript_22950/g.35899  ORF Transcript_22950/g.35899 Transcript_22950/m.35899 type:complete len:660 (+) Transcript_22950:210-2189(+)|eukprot:CAMPEP_0201722046 /NCGR_PEP_ID=MMETSP0593-20130828/6532_1 /ASSEMBLY_ACC=CAM_ASM_000672 /TAXON_ID=267983 /ORGANISM="Skeletonema japonicum, Strain CCMP2506" /LENGTH=659 /DNA_ID=CAMNT_0048212947 /DNA_START=137 /DNA_END=2116 /DNA_ORIENTATION=+